MAHSFVELVVRVSSLELLAEESRRVVDRALPEVPRTGPELDLDIVLPTSLVASFDVQNGSLLHQILTLQSWVEDDEVNDLCVAVEIQQSVEESSKNGDARIAAKHDLEEDIVKQTRRRHAVIIIQTEGLVSLLLASSETSALTLSPSYATELAPASEVGLVRTSPTKSPQLLPKSRLGIWNGASVA
jgi:hypothetical protein